MSDRGTYIRKPVVGLGVQGMKTAIVVASRPSSLSLISVSFSLAMKTIDQTPRRGYSTRPTLLNMSALLDSTVSKICFRPR